MDEGNPEGDDDVEGVVLGNRNSIPSSTIPQLGRPGGFDTPTTLERLPIELITQIVRDVRSDKKALTAIASLNKAWREFCLPYLFECLVVKSPQPGQLLRFLIFAEGRPHIRPHIKHLILCPSGPPSPDRYLVVDSLEVIKRILACLRSLQALTLRHVWFRDCQGLSDGFTDSPQDPTIVRIDRDGPYPLSRLIVDGCLAGPWGTQGEFYGLFAGVLTLFRVRIVWFRSFRTPFQMPRGVVLREIIRKDPPMIHGVEHLVLKPAPTREFTRDIVNALRARLAPDTLRSIVLVEASKVLIRAVGILIQDKARGVAELSLDATKIDASYLENTPVFWNELCISSCTNLSFLTFQILIECTRTPEDAAVCTGQGLCHALAYLLAITPRTLGGLTVLLQIKGTGTTQPQSPPRLTPAELGSVSDFRAIESALPAPVFQKLERVSVNVLFHEHGEFPAEERARWLKEIPKLFPRLQERGLLVVAESRPHVVALEGVK